MAIFGLGAIFLLIGICGAIPPLFTGRIGALWPMQPIHREKRPALFRLYVTSYGAVSVVGIILMSLHLLERLTA